MNMITSSAVNRLKNVFTIKFCDKPQLIANKSHILAKVNKPTQVESRNDSYTC